MTLRVLPLCRRNLRHTKFEDSNLTDSDFLLADLREAYIGGSSAELQGAKFTRARLEGLTFGSSGSLPNIGSFAEAQGLNALAYEGDSPSTLSWIREELKRRGFTEQENENHLCYLAYPHCARRETGENLQWTALRLYLPIWNVSGARHPNTVVQLLELHDNLRFRTEMAQRARGYLG